jgi:2-keto-myo-inositol isomerase
MFKLCLNTSTLRGYKLPLREEIEIAARAGYDAIEPWIAELEAHEASGGSMEELASMVRDNGLSVQGRDWIFRMDCR